MQRLIVAMTGRERGRTVGCHGPLVFSFCDMGLGPLRQAFRALLFPMRFPNASRGRWRALTPLQLLMLPNRYPLIGEQRVRFPSGFGRARSGRRKLIFGTLAGLTAAASEFGRSNATAEASLRLSDKTREVLAPRQGSNLQPSGSKPDALSG